MKSSPRIPLIATLFLLFMLFLSLPIIPLIIEAKNGIGPIDFAVTNVTWKKVTPNGSLQKYYNISSAFVFEVEGKIRNRYPYTIKYITPNLDPYVVLINVQLQNKSISYMTSTEMRMIIPDVTLCKISPGITDLKDLDCHQLMRYPPQVFLYFKDNITGTLPFGTYYLRIVGENSKLNGYIYGATIVSSYTGIKVSYEKPFGFEYYVLIYYMSALLFFMTSLIILVMKNKVEPVKII